MKNAKSKIKYLFEENLSEKTIQKNLTDNSN